MCSTNHALLEAQASGLPALVMERGSAAERISERSGCVCRSTVDLIVETAALVRNDVRRKAMGKAAREHALQQGLDAAVAPLFAEYRAQRQIQALVGSSAQPSFRRADAFNSNSAMVAST